MRSPLDYNNILVTGGSGQLGSEWSRYLASKKRVHHIPTRTELNLGDPDSIRGYLQTIRPDYVIHCGAYTNVDQAEDEPDVAEAINHLAVGILAEYCSEHMAPLIHYSTDYVFGEAQTDAGINLYGFGPNAPTNPLGVYGLTKLRGESIALATCADTLIIRVSWLCGPVGHNFVRTMLRLAETRSQINVVDDQVGSPTFTFDVIRITEKLASNGVVGVWHVSSNGILSWADFAEKIFELRGSTCSVHRISTSEYKTKAKRPLYSKLDCRATEAEIGDSMPDWSQSLSKLLQQLQ